MATNFESAFGGRKEPPVGKVTVKNVSREVTFADEIYVPAIVSGLGATIRHFFKNIFGGKKKYTQTIRYPDEKVKYPVRFRGLHRLVPREDGTSRCVACFMCETACPAHCIHIEAGENDDPNIEKYPVVFDIDELRCVVCGLCVEACPCDAIRMDTGIHPPPVYGTQESYLAKTDLLANLGAKESLTSRSKAKPPPTAAGTGRLDRSSGDKGAGGSSGGY